MSSNKRELKVKYTKGKPPNKTDPFGKDILVASEGQWKYPGMVTRVPGGDITMNGVPYPVMAIPNVGTPTMMYPGMNYSFPGSDYVDEIPLAQSGKEVEDKQTAYQIARNMVPGSTLFLGFEEGLKGNYASMMMNFIKSIPAINYFGKNLSELRKKLPYSYTPNEMLKYFEITPEQENKLNYEWNPERIKENVLKNQAIPDLKSINKPVAKTGGWLDKYQPGGQFNFYNDVQKLVNLPKNTKPVNPDKLSDTEKAMMERRLIQPDGTVTDELGNVIKKNHERSTGATETTISPIDLAFLPANLPIQAASKLGKAGVFALEALNPIGGVKNLKSNVINKSASSVVENTAKQLSNSNNVASVINTIPNSWSMQELPGLHLKSTMSDGPVSKIVEPKTGLINVEQALGIIGKESGGADKVALIKQGLGDNIPKKMDYNEFRKVVQDQLIPLERQFAIDRSNYGISSLGYPSPKYSSFQSAIQNGENYILQLENQIKNINSLKESPDGGKLLNSLTEELNQAKINLDFNKSMLSKLPLENQTLILGNKFKFGRGSSAHGNPEETLGHIHFLRDAETPDVLTVTQIQSDAFQGTHRIMPKNAPDVSKSQFSLQRMEEIQNRNKAVLNKMKTEGVDEAGVPVQDYQIKQFEDIVKAQEQSNLLKKAELENFSQKSLLDKNHQERYLQELVDYAGERGDINKLRLPTSETATKVQGYKPVITSEEIIEKYNKLKGTREWDEIILNTPDADKVRFEKVLKGEIKGDIYALDQETILKKYKEQPKTIKKLFGVEPKIVTDSKGNSWYEFDIPKKFKEGKGEIKAFGLIPPAIIGAGALQEKKSGGWLDKYQTGRKKGGWLDNVK